MLYGNSLTPILLYTAIYLGAGIKGITANFGKTCFPFLNFERKHCSRQMLLALSTQIHRHGGTTTCISCCTVSASKPTTSVEYRHDLVSTSVVSISTCIDVILKGSDLPNKKPDIKVCHQNRVSLNFHYFWLHSGILHYKRTYYIIPRQSSGRLLPNPPNSFVRGKGQKNIKAAIGYQKKPAVRNKNARPLSLVASSQVSLFQSSPKTATSSNQAHNHVWTIHTTLHETKKIKQTINGTK